MVLNICKDPTRLDLKILSPAIDAGATGGIQFYTGKSMERKASSTSPRLILKDDNNSTVDFEYFRTQLLVNITKK